MPCREDCGVCKCIVLFSDDAQKFLKLKSLNEEQQLLGSKKQSLMQQLDLVRDSAASANEVYKNACKAAEKRQNEVGPASVWSPPSLRLMNAVLCGGMQSSYV